MKAWLQNKLLPTMNKIGNQRHLATIRDAFAVITPIIIAGSFAVLWRSVLFSPGAGKGALTGLWFYFNDFIIPGEDKSVYYQILQVLSQFMVYLQVATINSISIYVVAALGYYLAKNKSMDSPYLASVLALTSYLISINLMTSVNWEASLYWLGARGMLGGIIIAIIAVELYSVLSKNNRLAITMPEGVPPAVGRAFAKLFPIIFSLLFVAIINLIVWLPTYKFLAEDPLWDAKESASLQISLNEGFKFNQGNTKLFFDLFGKNKEHFDLTNFESLKNWLDGKESTFDPKKIISTEQIELLNQTFRFKEVKPIFDPNGDMLGEFMKATPDAKKNILTVLSNKPLSGGMTFVAFVYVIAIAPFLSLVSTTPAALLGVAMLYVFIASIFWFAGLHGINIANGIFNPIWLLLYAQNVSGQNHIFVQGTFDAFIFIGGSGASLALLIATLIFGTRKTQHHEISKLSTGAGVFQINEPVIYGYPIMLNPVMFIPFVIVMPILCITTHFGYMIFGDYIKPVNVIVPWTVPFIAAAFLATSGSWAAIIIALVNFVIAFLIYLPFILITNYQAKKAEKELEEQNKKIKTKDVLTT